VSLSIIKTKKRLQGSPKRPLEEHGCSAHFKFGQAHPATPDVLTCDIRTRPCAARSLLILPSYLALYTHHHHHHHHHHQPQRIRTHRPQTSQKHDATPARRLTTTQARPIHLGPAQRIRWERPRKAHLCFHQRCAALTLASKITFPTRTVPPISSSVF